MELLAKERMVITKAVMATGCRLSVVDRDILSIKTLWMAEYDRRTFYWLMRLWLVVISINAVAREDFCPMYYETPKDIGCCFSSNFESVNVLREWLSGVVFTRFRVRKSFEIPRVMCWLVRVVSLAHLFRCSLRAFFFFSYSSSNIISIVR
jgi:hypothetical protein